MSDREEYELLSEKANEAQKRRTASGNYVHTKSLKETIIIALFFIWFIGSFCAFFVFSEIGSTTLLLVAFGQYFAVFALIFFCATGDSLMPLIHYTVGVLLMTVPSLVKASTKISDMSMNDKVALGCCIIAILSTYYMIIKERYREKNRETFFLLEMVLLALGVIGIVYWSSN